MIVIAESIPNRFAHAMEKFAARTAVSAPAGQWTYAELDQRSGLITTKILDELGEGCEPVALLMAHDAPLIAAIFGALKAGKIYLVLDPDHPAEQLTAMLAASGAKLLVADAVNLELANALATDKLKVLPHRDATPADLSRVRVPEISPDSAAWLMFTSGSTSAPKGVWQNHRGLVQEAEVYAELIDLAPEDRVALLASGGLSASGATLFATLFCGATLCLFHVRSQGVERLATWLAHERITIFHSVPTIFRHLARQAIGKNSFATLRLIRLGGEPVLRGDMEAYQRQCPDHCRFMQSLSSTETGLICTLAMDKQTKVTAARVPAGRAVRGVEIFLVDENNRPLNNGGEGKIAVRSARLRQGYWRQPELTAEKFLADGCDAATRIFVSNDLGKFLPDGLLEHLGRADQLVKIRGQRVDLGEVEAAVVATGLAAEAVVIAREDHAGEKRLAAYLVPRGGDASPANLRHELRRHLPDYMIPNHFVPLEKLPQTAAGKVDRKVLNLTRLESLSRSPQKPPDETERRLIRIWEATLEISPISRTDDFFELGGNSLHLVEVSLRSEEEFGVPLPLWALAEYGTVEKLAVLLSQQTVIASPTPLVKMREGAGGRPLFLIHTGRGGLTAYGLLARRLGDRPIYGLQSIGLQGESWPLMSVTAMAQRYLPEIIAKDPTGPYLLAGACMGGLVALEIARLLVQQKRSVGLVVLIETAHPVRRWQQPGWKEKIYCPIRDSVRDALRIARWAVIRASGRGQTSQRLPAYRRFVANMNFLANRFHQPKPFPGTITLFIATENKLPESDRRLRLRQYARESVVFNISTNHDGLFTKPAVDELARHLQTCLDSAEKKTQLETTLADQKTAVAAQ